MNRRNLASVIGLVTGALVVSALLVEGILRLYAGVTDTSLAQTLRLDPYDVQVEPHGTAGFRPRPDRTFRYDNRAAANTNEMGFRGPAVPVAKPAGTYRIVLLGGSTTFGWGVNDDETIAWHMRQILSERYPGRMIEVVNLAFDGYDSYQQLERLRSDGVRLQPDAVIVNSGINDVRNAWFTDLVDGDRRTLLYRETMDHLRLEQARGGPTSWTRAKHYLYLARLPGWLRARVSAGAARANPEHTFHWDALDYFERNLMQLVELSTASGSTVVLLSTPPSSLRTLYEPTQPPLRAYWIRDAETTQVYRDSLSARMRGVAAAAASRGQPVAYVSHEVLPPELFLDDAHLTPAGNRRVAEDFVEALEPWIS